MNVPPSSYPRAEVYIQLRYSLQPNFLALSEGSDRPSGIEDYAADLQKMEAAGANCESI